MILATVFGVSLVLQTSLSGTPRSSAERGEPVLALHQRDAAMLPLLHRATECIVRKVKGDPRFHAELRANDISDLIVDAIPNCEQPVRSLIDTHDRMFGAGSGEVFFTGPYLDILPAAVTRQVTEKPATK